MADPATIAGIVLFGTLKTAERLCLHKADEIERKRLEQLNGKNKKEEKKEKKIIDSWH